MKKIAFVFLISLLFLGCTMAQQTGLLFQGAPATASTTGVSTITAANSNSTGYCSDIFGNTKNIVDPALYNGVSYTGLISISFLIIIMVITVLSLVYGIGYAFGIQKLVNFAKTEYVESFFNILLLVAIVGGITSLNWVGNFFSSTASTVTGNPPASGSGPGLYTALCNNIMSTQVVGGVTLLIGTSLTRLAYSAIQGSEISFEVSGNPYYSVNFAFEPFEGLALATTVINNELTAIVVMIGMGLALIFLFFAICFLFPVFLYLGILFRFFPWTRAAGGTFLALFIGFYLVFPAVFYPFTSTALSTAGLTQFCSTTTLNPLCVGPSTNIATFAGTMLGYLGTSAGSGFLNAVFSPITGINANLNAYAAEITYFAMDLFGLFISFIVSYDLVEMLGDVLGAPSITTGKLFSKLI